MSPTTPTRDGSPPPDGRSASIEQYAVKGDGTPRIPAGLEQNMTSAVDQVLEANGLMTTGQAVQVLNAVGVTNETILQVAQNGLDASMETSHDFDGIPNEFPSREEDDVEDLISILSQSGWRDEYELLKSSIPDLRSNPHMSHLIQMTTPIPYNDLDSNVNRYAYHLRPKIKLPPYSPVKQNPITLQVETDPAQPGFKARDPSIIIIYVIGPPGSGKTTVAQAICDRYHLKYIGVNQLLQRERQDPASPYKSVLDDMLSKGLLGPYKMVPAILMSEILKEMEKGFKQIFFIDGFPRGLDRAVYFEETMQPCDGVFLLDCPDKISLDRMMKSPDAPQGGSMDERKRNAEKQLEVYHKEADIVVDYYKKQGKIINVDATVSIQHVQAQMELKLKDAIVDGFVGTRQEVINEKHRQAWERMREGIEKQWIDRGYTVVDSSDSSSASDINVPSFDEDVDMEEGGVSLNIDDEDSQPNEQAAFPTGNGCAPSYYPQPTSHQGNGHTIKASREHSNGAKVNGNTGSPSNSETGNESILVRNAGKTPGPRPSQPLPYIEAAMKQTQTEPPRSNFFKRARERVKKASPSESPRSSSGASEESQSHKNSTKVAEKKVERKPSLGDKIKEKSECRNGQQ
ncbi:hypothetical protein H072_8110 [Dactylellina haptotyla CBS 200.50]|uniref:Adenylate kinase n=1 Tax=Dactylellina haptotyla (strain CBS 200.50) TaxID=1284197 RepID=S8A640_DACHA|nr:hypothetical protein H072_8110 [Dactylellina haptotyla CBS 200.50]